MQGTDLFSLLGSWLILRYFKEDGHGQIYVLFVKAKRINRFCTSPFPEGRALCLSHPLCLALDPFALQSTSLSSGDMILLCRKWKKVWGLLPSAFLRQSKCSKHTFLFDLRLWVVFIDRRRLHTCN